VLLVDGANVVGSRPTGWWRDRPGAAKGLYDRLRAAARAGQLEPPVVLVLEGAACRGVEVGAADGVEVVHAAGEGDETLAALADSASEPVTLVSADRALGARIRDFGGEVVGPNWLYERLPG
jgi:hypothetical protein